MAPHGTTSAACYKNKVVPSPTATLAQLVERLIRNQQVAGSIPAGGSRLFNQLASTIQKSWIQLDSIRRLSRIRGRFLQQMVERLDRHAYTLRNGLDVMLQCSSGGAVAQVRLHVLYGR
jgi:hypothetical protein